MTVANLKVFLISRGMNRESDWELSRFTISATGYRKADETRGETCGTAREPNPF
jgi:hypothetical protein